MKRFVTILATLLVVLSLASCNSAVPGEVSSEDPALTGISDMVSDPAMSESSHNQVEPSQTELSKAEPAHVHSYEWTVVTEPSCLDAGLNEGVCKGCGDKITKEIAATGHKFGSWEIKKEASCTETGKKVRTCTRCGETESESINKMEQEYGEWITDKSATCTAAGKKHRVCENCGKKVESDIKAIGHSYGSWVEDKKATCTEAGSKHRECKTCKESETQTIKAKGHDWKKATCTDPKTCKTCKATEGEPLGHNISGSKCKRCGMKCLWEKRYFVDNFKEKTSDWYVTNSSWFKCVSGNSYSTDKNCKGQLVASPSYIAIRMTQYSWSTDMVKSAFLATEYSVSIRLASGETKSFTGKMAEGYDQLMFDSKGMQYVLDAFKTGKDFAIYAVQKNLTAYNYLMTIEVSNFNELYAECKGQSA